MLKTTRQLQYGNSLLKNIDCIIREYIRVNNHIKCRSKYYPGTKETVTRYHVLDRDVDWRNEVFYAPYEPPEYTAKVVLSGPEWADPDLDGLWPGEKPRWNLDDGQEYNRECGVHLYLVNNSVPLNPIGRTGVQGRGIFGRWGPNHQVHLIFSRWCTRVNNVIKRNKESDKLELEVLSVKRSDVKQWALPGKFLRKNENIHAILKRCLIEEGLDNLRLYNTDRERLEIANKFSEFLKSAELVYRGYVDDPRNTDNAWVSSTIMHVHDEFGNVTKDMVFQTGDSNILDVSWINTNKIPTIGYFGNHEDFIKATAKYLSAHYPEL